MDTDKVLNPFVSDDVVNECFKNLEEVWSCTEYEQLLTEVKVKADKKAESEATKNMRLRYDAVVKCLNQLEAAAGENKVWWEKWRKEVNGSEDYTKIDFEWYNRNIPAVCTLVVALYLKMCEAAKADELLNPAEQIFLTKCSPIPEMCREVCKAMGIDEALTKGGQLYVVKHLKAICLYIALRNEQNKLREEAELYGIPFKEATKQQQQQQNKKTTENKALAPEAKRIFDAAVEDGRFMKKTENGGYEWTFLDNNPTKLCFFLQEVYKPQSPPWEQLQKLFARTETLKTLAYQMKQNKWYKDWNDGGQLPKSHEWVDDIVCFVKYWKPKNKQA